MTYNVLMGTLNPTHSLAPRNNILHRQQDIFADKLIPFYCFALFMCNKLGLSDFVIYHHMLSRSMAWGMATCEEERDISKSMPLRTNNHTD